MRGASYWIPKGRTAGFAPQWSARAAASWTPAQLNGLALWLPGHLTRALWQENLTGTPLTQATADGNLVGQIDDQGPHAHRATAGSSGREPALGSGGGRPNFLTFDGSNDFLLVENSKQAFSYVHTTVQFTLLAWVKMSSDGANRVLVDSARGGGSDKVGFFVRRNASGNTITLAVCKGSAGNLIVLKTTTATLTVAHGWQLLVIRGTGTGGTIQIGSQAAETFTAASPAAEGTPATDDLHIGAVSVSLGSYFHGSLGDLALCNVALSDAEIEPYRNFAPPRSQAALGRALAAGTPLAPQQLSHCYQHYDFSDATRLFQQIDKTGAVSADSDPIGCVEHRGGAALKRDAAATANDDTRPLFRTAVKNGLAAAQWDGADDQLAFFDWCIGGALTVFLVAKNSDVNSGSHYLQGAQYIVQTGSNYLSGGDERFVIHPVGNPAPVIGSEDGLGDPVAGEAWHVYEFTRDADAWQIVVDGVSGPDITNAGVFTMNNMGQQSNAGFWLDGYVGELVKYNVAHSAVDRAKVRAGLGAKWGIVVE